MTFLILFLSLLFMASPAFAWGPLTHIYLGNEIFSLGSLLPAGIYALIRKYRHDFLYGNLMADIIVGKKFIPDDRNPHSWDVALGLFDSAKTQQQKAFVYGYMSHLAADTVAHGSFTGNKKNLGHTLVEMRADSIIDKKYWLQAIRIDRKIQTRNDLFLEKSLDRAFFSFKTHKRIFKSVLFLSCLNKERVGDIIQRNAVNPTVLSKKKIIGLQDESINKMVDIIRNGKMSPVLQDNPMVTVQQQNYSLISMLSKGLPSRRSRNKYH